jgi:3,4-dihydroxy 2-butanone 4-phosphate synthase / GTP cyclohydrolase II
MKLNTIEEAIEDIRQGKVIIIVDDENRENEGDLVCAAELVTPEIINFMATHARGLICTPIEDKKATELDLPFMVTSNTELHGTAFTVSVDLIGHGCSTGISAYDRATGIRALVSPDFKPADFARPGHIFPLVAKKGGVLRRTGHTEAAVDFARLAGLTPAGVVVEIMNEDGTMARLPQLMEIAKRFSLKIVSIDDLIAFRMRHERLIKREMNLMIPSQYGDLEVFAYSQMTSGDIHLAIKKGSWTKDEPVMVRVHSSTETGDILGNIFEGNDTKLSKSFEMIAKEGRGLFLYMHQSEKGLSMLARLKEYKNQLDKKSTPQHDMDERDYGIGAQILRDLNISKIRLITQNSKRRVGMVGYGLEIVENIDL